MPQSAPMGPDDLRAISALLDEALDLPADVRHTWLAGLPAAAAPYHDALHEMLAHAEAGTGAGLIGGARRGRYRGRADRPAADAG